MQGGRDASRIVNLTLHGIGEPKHPLERGEAGVWLGEDALIPILNRFQSLSGYLITVDDGNASDVDILLPSLERRGLNAVFFVPAGRLGRPGYVSPEGLKTLARAGMEIGTHGMDHRDWRTLSDAEIAHEIGNSKKVLEDIVGQPVAKAACPYGSYDRRVLSHLNAAGFERVYTSDGGQSRADWWIQPRRSLHATDTVETVRGLVEDPPAPHTKLIGMAKRIVKRWR